MREVAEFGDAAELDAGACLFLTARYVRAQRWALIGAPELAERIWPGLEGRKLRGREARRAVENAIWQHYATVLYDCCRQQDRQQRESAWAELRRWLAEKARAQITHAQDREDAVQEALVNLQKAFEKDALQAPRALWAFALQALRNSHISQHRRRTAQKRGEGKAESLEAAEERQSARPRGRRPLTAAPGVPPLRPLEERVMNRFLRQQLESFLEQHIASDLQVAVAKAVFLDGYSPSDVAALLGKSPHEVRMVKSRVVRTLRTLPANEQERLREILDAAEEEESGDARHD